MKPQHTKPGIFIYTTSNNNGENKIQYITHFEDASLKAWNAKWLGVSLMEYQKSDATQKEWEALKD